jgi:hypothetical protein
MGDARTACELLQLPLVEKDAVLFYRLNNYPCDQVHIFYTDRFVRVRPHRVGFEFDPIANETLDRSAVGDQTNQN